MVRVAPEVDAVDTTQILLAAAGAFLLAGFVKGVIGMGLPTVSIGLLGLLLTPAQAAAILLVPSIATNIWQFAVGGSLFALLKRMAPLIAGICIGTFAGALWLPGAGSKEATLWLGLALAVYAALGLFNIHFVMPPRAERWIGLLAGIATGAITVATGVFAIPMVPYIQAMQFDRDRLVQALGLSFTVSTMTLAAALGHAGEISAALAWPALAALVAALIGVLFGQIIRGRVKEKTFRLCFFAGLLLLGLHLALRGLI